MAPNTVPLHEISFEALSLNDTEDISRKDLTCKAKIFNKRVPRRLSSLAGSEQQTDEVLPTKEVSVAKRKTAKFSYKAGTTDRYGYGSIQTTTTALGVSPYQMKKRRFQRRNSKTPAMLLAMVSAAGEPQTCRRHSAI